MRLTAAFSRITARPHEERCPNCFRLVADLFIEWYRAPDPQRILRRQAAMDCPFCRKGILFDGKRLESSEGVDVPVPVLVRDLGQATRWAQLSYPDLESFLTSEDPMEQRRAQPFRRGYWPEVNV